MIPYNKKFEYKSLSRVTTESGFRTYEIPSGDKVPSVTTIISNTADKAFLKEWRKRVGHNEANYITKLSSGVGTIMHEHLECWIKDEERPSGNNLPRKVARRIADVIIDKGLSNVSEVWGMETPLYYPGLYAGTSDLIGLHCATPAILDFKNTRKPKKLVWVQDYFIQLAGYIEAHNEVYNTNIQKGVIMMVSREEPYVGEYQEFIIEGNEYNKYKDMWWQRVEDYYISIGQINE